MKNRFLFALSAAASLLSLSACCDNDVTDNEQTVQSTGSEIVLGEKEDSPLLLRNMQRAIDTLAARRGLRSSIVLSPTHYYVRFLPADSAEYERIKADTSLVLTSYPLDYELSEGDTYHDPSIPADDITWQYTVVPADYDLEGTHACYEKLEELFIQSEDLDSDTLVEAKATELKSAKTKAEAITWRQLVNEAVTQTTGEQAQLKSHWTPQATIKAYDDLLQDYVPLQGVKVRIRYFAFLFAHHFTDANGHVSFSSKRTKVEYSIVWESDKWDIRNPLIQAFYDGPHKKSAWSLNIGSGTPFSLHYAAIHRALYKYYYGNTLGLSRPTEKLKVSYHSGSDPDCLGKTYHAIVTTWHSFFSAIKIYGKSNGMTRSVSQVLGTSLHELTHAAYDCQISLHDYNETKKIIIESWAVFGEWLLMRDIYTDNFNATEFVYKNIDWINYDDETKDYSPLFIDIIDIDTPSTSGWEFEDNIYGYNVKSIDKSITKFRNLDDVEKFLKNYKPTDITDEDIDRYLKIYKDYKKQ